MMAESLIEEIVEELVINLVDKPRKIRLFPMVITDDGKPIVTDDLNVILVEK